MYTALFETVEGTVLQRLDESGEPTAPPEVCDRTSDHSVDSAMIDAVRREESRHPRWVWSDTAHWYPPLLHAGVRIERCVDLRLSHAILRRSALTAASALATAAVGPWDRDRVTTSSTIRVEATLFDFQQEDRAVPLDSGESIAEFRSQRDALRTADDPRRLGLLLAAESAGALIASEIMFAGLPWREDEHNRIISAVLGPRPELGARPALLQRSLDRLRLALEAPLLNPDSPPELLKALAVAGLMVSSTRSWELKKLDHPAIEPLLEYKKLSRLFAASGWNWLDANVQDGRFHPEYVPGGVVTGRWASKGGGGALQLPKQIRGAVVADPGWKFVVADASQLEPRILAALSGDRGMSEAGAAGDLYAGIVATGAVATRDQAKVAMLGAMYGATSGEGGRLLPQLARVYPRAVGLVEAAARAGERGEVVTTRLGRSSPLPGPEWFAEQAEASGESATEAGASRARGRARSWGRFTRNFIVQGSAAEWALCWMANLRRTLHEVSPGKPIAEGPHLVFFMHDEVVVHTPAEFADEVAQLIRSAAVDAGTLLFAAAPVNFPVTVAIVDNYGQAK